MKRSFTETQITVKENTEDFFKEIPKDILLHIFTFLGLSDIKNASQVNKEFGVRGKESKEAKLKKWLKTYNTKIITESEIEEDLLNSILYLRRDAIFTKQDYLVILNRLLDIMGSLKGKIDFMIAWGFSEQWLVLYNELELKRTEIKVLLHTNINFYQKIITDTLLNNTIQNIDDNIPNLLIKLKDSILLENNGLTIPKLNRKKILDLMLSLVTLLQKTLDPELTQTLKPP